MAAPMGRVRESNCTDWRTWLGLVEHEVPNLAPTLRQDRIKSIACEGSGDPGEIEPAEQFHVFRVSNREGVPREISRAYKFTVKPSYPIAVEPD